ncbi:nucleoside/nucleotide kinase family protein [Epibacterium sp. MM17-32]|uniref:nucleoside/nucleotide kinase family protein n=1 Tax=Epibacterium sp. MM17-32 TaxID=2917734 RepID=UPI001EF73E0D|nr:nucleoside/nucleotide kinase family protein [Epibacterium sp. MM17-32]MCG7629949.1 nucleoside/nucleotide kinase family protein [Epibacterium sp. MM17-32]
MMQVAEEALCAAVLSRLDLHADKRCLVALSGAPGSGKSTLSGPLAQQMTEQGIAAEVVPMDGFHLDNGLLEKRDLLARKGAPETFDLAGFSHLCRRLRHEDHVIYPLFDRNRDAAIAGAGEVTPECRVVIVEGNYLLFDEPGWRDLFRLWDVSIRMEVPLAELETRLIRRWRQQGLGPEAALVRARSNDLANAARVAAAQLPADLIVG